MIQYIYSSCPCTNTCLPMISSAYRLTVPSAPKIWFSENSLWQPNMAPNMCRKRHRTADATCRYKY